MQKQYGPEVMLECDCGERMKFSEAIELSMEDNEDQKVFLICPLCLDRGLESGAILREGEE